MTVLGSLLMIGSVVRDVPVIAAQRLPLARFRA
jgi:hypothetical protein